MKNSFLFSVESMDTSKQIFEKERREKKSQEVKIQFQNPNDFVILDDDNNIKYYGYINRKDKGLITDDCSCPSFQYGMRYDKITEGNLKGESNFFKEHGEAFQCKHIIKAKEVTNGRD